MEKTAFQRHFSQSQESATTESTVHGSQILSQSQYIDDSSIAKFRNEIEQLESRFEAPPSHSINGRSADYHGTVIAAPQSSLNQSHSVGFGAPDSNLIQGTPNQHLQSSKRSFSNMSPPNTVQSDERKRRATSSKNNSQAKDPRNISTSLEINDSSSRMSTNSNHTNKSYSMSSNQTLITSHTKTLPSKPNQKKRSRAQSYTSASTHGDSNLSTYNSRGASSGKIFVAETPPTADVDSKNTAKPGSFARNGAMPKVARTILSTENVEGFATAITNNENSKTPSEKKHSMGNKRKSTKPVKASLKQPDKRKSPKTPSSGNPNKSKTCSPPLKPEANIASVNTSAVSLSAPPTTRRNAITNYFSFGQQKKSSTERHPGSKSVPQDSSSSTHALNEVSNERSNEAAHGYIDNEGPMKSQLENVLRENTFLKQTIDSLNQSLEEKTSQLKAVANNQTIIHAQLKNTLQKREEEIKQLEAGLMKKNELIKSALEVFIRKESAREQAELRQKIASDGARLGKWVYNWVGMRKETVWEDGSAMRLCQKKRQAIESKRKHLMKRLETGYDGLDSTDLMEKESFEQSIRIHLEELDREQEQIKQEEDNLRLEKNAHRQALTQISNEDYSTFKSRPKVRIARRSSPSDTTFQISNLTQYFYIVAK